MRTRRLLLIVAAACVVGCAPAPSPPPTVSSPVIATATPAAPAGATPPTMDASAGATPEPAASAGSTPEHSGSPTTLPSPTGLTWQRWRPPAIQPGNAGPIGYASTFALDPACAEPAVSQPTQSGGTPCTWPVSSLPDHAVLITWYTTRLLWPIPTDGAPFTVVGEQSRIRFEAPGDCGRVHGEETLTTWLPSSGGRFSNVVGVACLRGPDLAGLEAQARAMLSAGL